MWPFPPGFDNEKELLRAKGKAILMMLDMATDEREAREQALGNQAAGGGFI